MSPRGPSRQFAALRNLVAPSDRAASLSAVTCNGAIGSGRTRLPRKGRWRSPPRHGGFSTKKVAFVAIPHRPDRETNRGAQLPKGHAYDAIAKQMRVPR